MNLISYFITLLKEYLTVLIISLGHHGVAQFW